MYDYLKFNCVSGFIDGNVVFYVMFVGFDGILVFLVFLEFF